MRALTWHGKRDVRVDNVPDPVIEEPTDAIVRITTTAICGSDLHLYEVLGPFMDEGDILGHEPMGIVEEVGSEVTERRAGRPRRDPVPDLAAARCFMCDQGLHTQCETTQVREQGMGAALFGYTKLYGQVPGGQAEFLRVPQANYTPIKVPEGPPDERFVYLSDVLPDRLAGRRVRGHPRGRHASSCSGSGRSATWRPASPQHRGHRVIGVDLVPERLERARRARRSRCSTCNEHEDDLADVIREMTDGRGPDSVIDAVGMEAHGSPGGEARPAARRACCPTRSAEPLMQTGGRRPPERALPRDRHRPPRRHDLAHRRLRRHGRPAADADHVRQADPAAHGPGERQALGRRHHAAADRRRPARRRELPHPPAAARARRPQAYEIFQKKQDGAIKVLLKP